MKIKLFFAWYDFWIGWFYDKNKRILYVCPIPMFVIKLDFGIKFKGINLSSVADKTVSVEGRKSNEGDYYIESIIINDF